MVETLLGYGADVHVHGGDIGETALHIAASFLKGTECALMLLKSGANPNVKQFDGQTPLHFAARIGSVEMIQLILDHGGNPQIQSDVLI